MRTALQNRGLITQAYTYDALNRLKTSNLLKNNNPYFELSGLNYDANGNITSLTRKLQNVAVDVLTYSYKPNNLNQIDKVEDTGTSLFFENKNVGSSDYAYDANGNTTKDLNKGITDISYNYLNLMQKVVVNGQTINYLHSSTGQKLNADFGVGKKYDYFGSGVWKNDTLEFVPTAEGRYTKTRGYEYYLKDHLGNLRISCGCKAGKAKIYQENHFDPWGADLADLGISGSVREKFTGKESQHLTGLIDFGARQYDNLAPHFLGVDALSQLDFELSPYVYVRNNPIGFIDMFGLTPEEAPTRDGGMLNEVKVTAKRDPIYTGYFGAVWANYSYSYTHNVAQKYSWTEREINKGIAITGAIVAAPLVIEAGVASGAGALLSQGASYLARLRAYRIGKIILSQPFKNRIMNFGATNFGAGIGDFTAQMAMNKGDITQVNWLSSAAQVATGGKSLLLSSMASSFIGNIGSVTLGNENGKPLGVDASINDLSSSSVYVNMMISTIGNIVAGAVGGQSFKTAYDGVSEFSAQSIDTLNNFWFGSMGTAVDRERQGKDILPK